MLGRDDGRVRIWRTVLTRRQPSIPRGGRYTFRADKSAVQLVIAADEAVAGAARPGRRSAPAACFPSPRSKEPRPPAAFAITPDASLVAGMARRLDASGRFDEDASMLAVWDSGSGRLVRKIEAARVTSDVALSPDGKLFAVGGSEDRSRISVCLGPCPRAEPVMTLERRNRGSTACCSAPISLRRNDPPRLGASLAAGRGRFGRNRDHLGHEHPSPAQLLSRFQLRRSRPGLPPRWHDLGFRGPARWSGSGTHCDRGGYLLDLQANNYNFLSTRLAFSPDAWKRLAVGGQPGFGSTGGADVWELEDDRGIKTLRGLLGTVEKAIMSSDGRLVAGLAQNWQIGIWDGATGRLIHVFDVPRGVSADNGALVLSADGRRFVCAAGRGAVLLDVATGQVIKTWELPAGFMDNLAFYGEQLLSVRVETSEKRVPPYGTDSRPYPRVVRIRELLGRNPMTPIGELRDFNLHVLDSAVSLAMAEVLWLSRVRRLRARKRISKLFEAPTGKEIATIPSQLPVEHDAAWFRFDPTGRALAHSRAMQAPIRLLAIPSLTFLDDLGPPYPLAIGAGGKRWLCRIRVTTSQSSRLTS